MVKTLTVNEYVKNRIVSLRIESNWPQRLIAHAFNMKVSAVNNILFRYKKQGPSMI